ATNMIWGVLLCCLLMPAAGYKTQARLPFFHGHVFENSPAASKVNGLSITVKRIDAQKWCPVSGMHFKLFGNGSEDFHVFAHHKRGNVALVKVDVLDTNDHEPTLVSADSVHISLDDTTALRTVVYRLEAVDEDSGRNAELTFASVPKNGSFYVVPKTGEVLLVDSILGLLSPITFYLYVRDHGWPPLASKPVLVTVSPQRWMTRSADLVGPERAGRSPRALLESSTVLSLNVSEDAGVGSVLMSLNPTRFQSAAYELIYPESESSPVTVGRDSGDITVTRRLDRETEPFLELTVKIQDKR
uniref:Cadherin domain-containing protein n=1 Tax=Poecilia formosa TaxID=48698 RepID=A0A096M9C8_POEFO